MRLIRFVLALCALAASALAARHLELADYYKLEAARSPAMSPDGRRVAFVRWHTIEAENRDAAEIWLSPADGSQPAVRLTNPAFNANAPTWSPDGKLLAFLSNRKGNGDVWFLHMDGQGGEAFQIEGVAGTPVFSPDNRWIAYTKRDAAAKKPSAATPFEQAMEERFKGRMYDWMNFRFDGRGYLPDPRDAGASPSAELYIVARAGGSAQQLTKLGFDVKPPRGARTARAWRSRPTPISAMSTLMSGRTCGRWILAAKYSG
jgi:Tol biopolymer transport system component